MSDGTVVIHVLPFAVVAALSPALLGASVELLIAFGRRGPRMLAGYLLGAAVVVLGFLTAAAALPQRHSRSGAVVQDVLDVVLAVVLLVLAAVLAVRKPRPAKPGRWRQSLSSRWAGVAVLGLGAAMMVTNISTLTAVVAGAHEAASPHAGSAARMISFVLLTVGALLPILLPLGWAVAAGAHAATQLARLNQAIGRHGRTIGIAVCLLTAAYLLVRGLGGL